MRKRPTLFGIPLGQWLTVFIIIALIYAILYPVFQKARPSRHGSCQSNLKILGTGLVQYSQDADENYPTGVNAAGNGWAGQIYPHNMPLRSYHCPDDPANPPFVSYAENQNISGQSLASFTAPAGTVELYEFTTLNCDPSKPETVSATGLTAPQDSARHDPKTFALNFLFVDGHVKLLPPGQVSNGPQAVPPTHKGKYLATFAVK